MPACPYCSESIPAKATVCPICGESLRGARGGGSRRSGGSQNKGMSGGTIVLIIVGCVMGVLVLCGGVAVALLLPAIQQARTAARSTQSKNNLKQIGLAFHNYTDSNGAFPIGGTFDENRRPMHSWQTRLLPFVDQGPLYNRISMDAPWDDPSNRSNASVLVPAYLDPNLGPPTLDAQGFGPSHYAGNSLVLLQNSSLTFREVTDGSSNTILAGQAGGGFKPWADPTNVRDPGLGLGTAPDRFGSTDRAGVQLLLLDGSVRTVNPSISPDVLKAMSTPNGGEPVPEF